MQKKYFNIFKLTAQEAPQNSLTIPYN